jgi:arsenate reductase (glutaredoxin)
MTVTIYHNPNCATSRNVLAMIRRSGEQPLVIEYLKNPPTRERLKELIAAMGIPVRALLREKGTPYAELGLGDQKWTDDQLLDFMMEHPILINRPIVVTPKGVKLCRRRRGCSTSCRIRISAGSSRKTARWLPHAAAGSGDERDCATRSASDPMRAFGASCPKRLRPLSGVLRAYRVDQEGQLRVGS